MTFGIDAGFPDSANHRSDTERVEGPMTSAVRLRAERDHPSADTRAMSRRRPQHVATLTRGGMPILR